MDYDWQDAYGRRYKLHELTDSHLINIIDHVRRIGYLNDLEDKFVGEAERRGLHQEMIDNGQMPHKNPNTGKWMKMIYEDGRVVALREISDNEANI